MKKQKTKNLENVKFDFTEKKPLPLNVLGCCQQPRWTPKLDPWMFQSLFSRKTFSGIFHQEFRDKILSIKWNFSPFGVGKIKTAILDGMKEKFLTSIARFSLVPATLASTISTKKWWRRKMIINFTKFCFKFVCNFTKFSFFLPKWRISTQQDVHNDSQWPEITFFIISQIPFRIIHESFHNFWGHKFSGSHWGQECRGWNGRCQLGIKLYSRT